jgi:rubrerythrin
MGAFFAKEIINAAAQIEKNGQKFYEQIAKDEQRPAVREVFEQLAEQEKRHVQELNYLSDQLEEPPDHTWEREDFDLYLDSITSEQLLLGDGPAGIEAGKIETDLQAVEFGIQFKKQIMLFFHELLPLVRAEERDILNNLISWERDHLLLLFRLKRRLKGADEQ